MTGFFPNISVLPYKHLSDRYSTLFSHQGMIEQFHQTPQYQGHVSTNLKTISTSQARLYHEAGWKLQASGVRMTLNSRWECYGGKLSWPILRCHLSVFLNERKIFTKDLGKDRRFSSIDKIRSLQNTVGYSGLA